MKETVITKKRKKRDKSFEKEAEAMGKPRKKKLLKTKEPKVSSGKRKKDHLQDIAPVKKKMKNTDATQQSFGTCIKRKKQLSVTVDTEDTLRRKMKKVNSLGKVMPKKKRKGSLSK